MFTSEGPTLDEIFRFISNLAVERHRAGKPLTGAVASGALRKAYPGFTPFRYSFPRFGDLMRRGHDDQYFVYDVAGSPDYILPIGASGRPLASARFPARQPGFLRRELWDAFVRDNGEPRAYNVARDTVVHGQAVSDADIPIKPVDTETQRSWLRDFCSKRPEPVDPHRLDEALGRQSWYVDVLGPESPLPSAMIPAWKRERTGRIREVVEQWKRENSLELDIELQVPGPTGRGVDPRAVAPPPTTRDDEIRTRILEALSRMPTAELVRLPIPVCYLVDSWAGLVRLPASR